ncbi:signal recognition particle receptor subunit beta-like [Tropilaelaps mercedesae]|uniref:Signal recognition particle receptor subunit beta n=1 Tax=Tropilaelaps mercedesae TaxID=418985 RepID=A0A1V9XFJ6_9ACAR|nr:signal recognition particle receptor subunit beta-like [Tropilaelaps mercedesae]
MHPPPDRTATVAPPLRSNLAGVVCYDQDGRAHGRLPTLLVDRSGVRLAMDELPAMDPTVVGIFVSLLIVLLSILVFLRSRTRSRNNVLICGISNAGKTVLYAGLCSGKPVQTYVSIKENQGNCLLANGRSFRLIDIPGNERQRVNIFDNYKATARAIVFVVDAVSFMKELKDVAEYAYTVLADPDTCTRHMPVLFACNKHDDDLAKSSAVIRSNLEKELNVLRKTQTSKLATTEGVQLGHTLGKENKPFEFNDLPQKIEFVDFSAKQGPEAVREWLSKV